jgi:tRNA G10  N-methylase Trm11
MKYFFILGRNPELSIAELLSYFEKTNLQIDNVNTKENTLIIETQEKIFPDKMIKELGGTIAIGEIISSGKKSEILSFINKNEIYFQEEIKFTYTIMNFTNEKSINDFDEILQKVKDKFKSEKLKAFYRSTTGMLDTQEKGYTAGTPSKIKSKDIVFFITENQDGTYSFGELKAVFDSKEAEKRDIEKPVRREQLAISPRLARILINLSQIKNNQTLLDPFCGIGALMIEALIQDINIIGIDRDDDAIKGAKRNLDWLKNKYKIKGDYNLINGDSRKINLRQEINGIATEPSLGELLKVTPTEEKAKQMIDRFENLIIDVLNNLKFSLNPGKKIAFTSPLIKTHHGKLGCNIQKIASQTNLKQFKFNLLPNIKFPIAELRKDSIVGREFYVLEK